MLNYKFKYLTFFFLFMVQIGVAQMTIQETPLSIKKMVTTNPPLIELNNEPVIFEAFNSIAPPQAGYTINVESSNLSKEGSWTQVSKTRFLWRISYQVKDASALSVYFEEINLNEGDQLYLYNPSKNQIIGAYTKSNNGSYLCTPFIENETIIIEYNTNNIDNLLPFNISEIGVRLQTKDQRGFGGAGACEVHINCEEGANWQQEKNGIARVLVKEGNLTFWCSGTLINNARVDGTPFFLTANHCGETATEVDYAQWMFYFNYQSENCLQPIFEPEPQTISGAELLAHSYSGTNSGSDFKLLLLEQPVPDEYNPYYNGWNREESPATSGVTIHHPQGDVKMISTYAQPLISSAYNTTIDDPDGKYWRVYWSETENGHGVTEGGSSGSPLFDSEGLIVGSLTGGASSCTFVDSPDYYGKFNYSWGSGSTTDSTKTLSYWLDPDQTGIMSLKGTDLDTTTVSAWFDADKTSIVIGESVLFENTSFGNITSYQWEFEGGEPSFSESEHPSEILYQNAGTFKVKLTVQSSQKTDSLVRENFIHVLPNISPNPGNGYFTLAFGSRVPDQLAIEVYDLWGKQAPFSILENIENYLTIDITPLRAGIYFIRLISPEQNNTYKVILTK